MKPDYISDLLITVDRAVPDLLALGAAASARPRAPGKWSPRQIIGHLVDSASHNHQRFVRAQWQDDLVFPGYAQDDWVAVQRYDESPWPELVTLWAAYNRHVAHVMAAVPDVARTRVRVHHNLDELAFRPRPAGVPATLDYLMRDYVEHLRHHLRQILGADWVA